MDFNVQCDTHAAQILLATQADLTLVPLWPTMRAQLRGAHLPRLRAAGPLGRLLARQGEAHAADHRMNDMGRSHPGLEDDLLNFQWDPVACAVALNWPVVETAETRLSAPREGELLRFHEDAGGRSISVLTGLDVDSFEEGWLETMVGPRPQGARDKPPGDTTYVA